MSQVGRTLKNLEAPRPLKSSVSRLSNSHHAPAYELQTSKFLLWAVISIWAKLMYYFVFCTFEICCSWRIDNIDWKCGRFCVDGTMQSRQHEHAIGEFACTWTAIGRLFKVNIGSRYIISMQTIGRNAFTFYFTLFHAQRTWNFAMHHKMSAWVS